MSIPESKNNRCFASSHRHGEVCEVGMLRSVIERSGEILGDASGKDRAGATNATSCNNSKGVLVYKEVGVAHSSEDGFVMKSGAKEPYLVNVNREAKEV